MLIKTTGLLMCNPRNLLPYRREHGSEPLAAALETETSRRCIA